MENQRFQPYAGNRRAYRSWLLSPNPVPPRSTRDRIMQRTAAENEEYINVPVNDVNDQVCVRIFGKVMKMYSFLHSFNFVTESSSHG